LKTLKNEFSGRETRSPKQSTPRSQHALCGDSRQNEVYPVNARTLNSPTKRGLSGSGGLPFVWKRRAPGFADYGRETRFPSSQTRFSDRPNVVTWGKTRSIRSIGEGRILPQNEVYPVRAELPSVWKRRAQGLLGCYDRETRFLSSQTQVPRPSNVVTWGKTRSIRSIGKVGFSRKTRFIRFGRTPACLV
jgi:hypothetical protein